MRVSFVCRSFAELTKFELYEILHLRSLVFVVGQKITAEPPAACGGLHLVPCSSCILRRPLVQAAVTLGSGLAPLKGCGDPRGWALGLMGADRSNPATQDSSSLEALWSVLWR